MFPVENKHYEDAPEVAEPWACIRHALAGAYVFTIFGYGAPASDVAAIDLLKGAWAPNGPHELKETEIVDIRDERALRDSWDDFIYEEHYAVHKRVSESWLFKHPRRSVEAFRNEKFNAEFIEDNLTPAGLSWDELGDWFGPLFDAEARASER